MKEWVVEPIILSLKPIIERFTEEADLVSDDIRQKVAERILELPPRRD